MKTVWAASEGAYSDYRVNCLFTTEALARAYVINQVQKRWVSGGYEGVLPVAPAIDADVKTWTKWEEAVDTVMYGGSFVESFDLFDALPIVEDKA